jgi:hypothetical protein
VAEPVNAFLFRGEIRGYWRLLARGAERRAIVHHRHTDRRFDFGTGEGGMAIRNGGIIAPTDSTVAGGRYLYRFVGTKNYNESCAKALMGPWWIDQDTWRLLRDTARADGMSLDLVARNFLAIPEEWGDCVRVARGKLARSLMAWTGIGNVVSARAGNYTPAQHNKAVQLFVPGDRELIGSAFGGIENVKCIYTREAAKVGW